MENFPSLWRNNSMMPASDPFRAMSRMQQQIDRMFEDMLSDFGPVQGSQDMQTFQPLFDLEDSETHYVMSVDLPGLKKEDVKVEVHNGQLRIHGERKEESESGKGEKKLRRRQYGSFHQVVTLPPGCKEDDIEAKFEDGVLKLAIPKGEQEKPKQISIGEKAQGFFSKLLGTKNGQTKEGKSGKQDQQAIQ